MDTSDNNLELQVDLTHSQRSALDILEQTQDNVFLTGDAGTGKTFLLSLYLSNKDRKKAYPVLGSTGVAALMNGGRTFHSFFGLGLLQGTPEAIIQKAVSNRNVRYRLRHAHTLIIDEISMLPMQALDIAQKVAQIARDSEAPWGGLRMIMVGDFAQLPPVSSGFQRPWAFLAKAWEDMSAIPVVLTEPKRTDSASFLSFLSAIRNGRIDDEVRAFLNARVGQHDRVGGTRLFPRRNQVNEYNHWRLSMVQGDPHEFVTTYQGAKPYVEALQKNAPIDPVLFLKPGAKVMVRVNDPLLRFVNGSVGLVLGVREDKVLVDIEGREYTFEKMTFAYLDGEGNPKATATNFPLQLAWSTTVHKSQGLSLDELQVDLTSLWEPGHAYVALSRAKDPNRLFIDGWKESSIKVDPLVAMFHQRGCPADFASMAAFGDLDMDAADDF